ncbi:hypothetical protein TCAL_16880 [Tigriopus californicus]|uniref:RING-type domain-containing protein n=1 Tax=Tigriopus californicus TaxID=6832 RepID=A0A553P6F4_TIGCA|nr:hypothetical protein TCAL_16880 [Tigriopus californicus]
MIAWANLWGTFCEISVWLYTYVVIWLSHSMASQVRAMFYPQWAATAKGMDPPEGSAPSPSWIYEGVAWSGGLILILTLGCALADGWKSRQALRRLHDSLGQAESLCGDLSQKLVNLGESQEKMCILCYTSGANVLFQPCLHLFCCDDCSNKIHICPFCHKPPSSKTVVFLV